MLASKSTASRVLAPDEPRARTPQGLQTPIHHGLPRHWFHIAGRRSAGFEDSEDAGSASVAEAQAALEEHGPLGAAFARLLKDPRADEKAK